MAYKYESDYQAFISTAGAMSPRCVVFLGFLALLQQICAQNVTGRTSSLSLIVT